MLTFLLRRMLYGLTVLFGVVSLVFFIFTLVPDPARELAGQSDSEEVVEAIRRKFSLDLPAGKRYVLFLNDLSPLSWHSHNPESRTWRAEGELSGVKWFSGDAGYWMLKRPYLGRSWMTERGVGEILSDALPGTFILALVAMAFALALGMLLGIVSALNKDTIVDRGLLVLASIGMSGPSFFMAILIAWLFGYLWHAQMTLSLWPVVFVLLGFAARKLHQRLRALPAPGYYLTLLSFSAVCWLAAGMSAFPGLWIHLPGTGLPMTGSLYTVDVWEGRTLALKHLVLPALTLGIRPLAVIIQLMRNSVLEVLGQDYIRTARAKGLSETKVMMRHVVRNALNPVLTASSGWLASMLAGAVFVEYVFGWKGLGMEVFRSLEKNDLPVVMGAVMVIAAVFVVINTLVDVLYGWIDPRVRLN